MSSIYAHKALTAQGQELDFGQFEGKVLLIVNTASKCGFTPQFEGLEELNKRYREQGLVVIGFPCNQFGHQDPGSDDEISGFCQLNYGVTFQMMSKVEVNGRDASPIFQYLKKQAGGFLTDAIKWNFTKFLISRDGKTVKRFAPVTPPKKLQKTIEAMLA